MQNAEHFSICDLNVKLVIMNVSCCVHVLHNVYWECFDVLSRPSDPRTSFFQWLPDENDCDMIRVQSGVSLSMAFTKISCTSHLFCSAHKFSKGNKSSDLLKSCSSLCCADLEDNLVTRCSAQVLKIEKHL